MVLSRLGNIVIKKDKKKIKKELYEIEKKQNLSDKEKEEIYGHLVELVRTLDKKEIYKYHNRDDLDYHGIRDIENLFDNVNDNDYYKPILVKSSFKSNYKYYESRGDKNKQLSVNKYLYRIMPYLILFDTIKGLINSFLNNYQKEEIVLRNRSNFVFESVDLLPYHLHKISLRRGRSYIKPPK